MILANFSKKLRENENILDRRGHVPGAPALDTPLFTLVQQHSWSVLAFNADALVPHAY